MKKSLVIGVFVLLFYLGLVSANSALNWNSSLNAYEIHNCTELQNMSLNLSGDYVLINNIDCAETYQWNFNGTYYQGFVPVGYYDVNWDEYPFTGTFNGRNHTISNLYMNWNNVSGLFVGGLFGYAAGSSIANVGVVNASITLYSDEWGTAGILASDLTNEIVSNVFVTGVVYSSISAGGLAAWATSVSFLNSYSAANITGYDSVGGLVGFTQSNCKINNSYSIGTVTGSTKVGGLVGNTSSATINNSYWDNETSGQSVGCGAGVCTGATGKTTAEMKNIFTFTGWDISTTHVDLNSGYPYLGWQNGSSSTWLVYTEPLFAIGDGSIDNPYQIFDWTDLNNVRQDLSAHYVLMNSLNSSLADYGGIGNNWTPIGNYEMDGGNLVGYFSGSFNGQGFTISNLNVSILGDVYYEYSGFPYFQEIFIGMFGISLGNISNLNVSFDSVNSEYGAGGLVGINNGTINNCSVYTNVSSSVKRNGGFVGINNGIINKSRASVLNSVFSSGSASSAGFVVLNYGNISNSSSTVVGSITSQIYPAGFVSDNRGIISDCNVTLEASAYIAAVGFSGASAFVALNNRNITGSFATVYDSATVYSSGNVNLMIVSYITPSSFISDSYGKIVNTDNGTLTFFEWNISKTSGDLLGSIFFEDNLLSIGSDINGLENGANVSLKCSEEMANPVILKDGVACEDCIFYAREDSYYLFSIESTGNYSISNSPVAGVSLVDSGSSYIISRFVSNSSLFEGYISNLRKGDSLKFNISNQIHNLTINNISNSSVVITVQSVPQTFVVKLGEVVYVDLNSDNINDLEISYLKYFTNIISLKVREISIPVFLVNVIKNDTVASPLGINDKINQDGINRRVIIILIIIFVFTIVVQKFIKFYNKR